MPDAFEETREVVARAWRVATRLFSDAATPLPLAKAPHDGSDDDSHDEEVHRDVHHECRLPGLRRNVSVHAMRWAMVVAVGRRAVVAVRWAMMTAVVVIRVTGGLVFHLSGPHEHLPRGLSAASVWQ
jgi:hypothetical protein